MHQASLGVRIFGETYKTKYALPFAASMWIVGVLTALASAAPATRPAAEDQPRLIVSHFTIQYVHPLPGLPSRQELLSSVIVNLHRVRAGYIAPQAGGPSLPYHLTESGLRNSRFSISALRVIQDAVRKYLSDQGVIAVFVYSTNAASKEGENGPDALDYNSAADAGQPVDVRMEIVVGVAKDVRAIVSGDRVTLPYFGVLPYPAANTIKQDSPIKPGQTINQVAVQDYLSYLNRQPGRHVDVALSSADTANEDDVTLDYLVHLNKPWTVYAQASNTGTRQTNVWAERFGFIDNELTGNDDVLSVDYNTDSFENTYTFDASYDVPVFNLRGVRAKAYGDFGKFVSSDLGIQGLSLNGDSREAGGEISANVYQYHTLFFDVFGGAKVSNYFVHVAASSDVSFLLPYFGVRMGQDTDLQSTHASLTYVIDPTIPGQHAYSHSVTAGGETEIVHEDSIDNLGLTHIEHYHYQILQGDASESFYIEPLLEGWTDRDTNDRPTAANEVYLAVHGQYEMNNKRLIAELQQTVGGLYTVRGYPESAVAGDTTIAGTAEYRFHIPRVLGVASGPGNLLGYSVPPPPLLGQGGFYYQPRAADSPGDWDLIAKAFIDAGYAHENIATDAKAFSGVVDAGLVGAGAGLELKLRDNVDIIADYGVALTPINEPNETVDQGSGRFNLVFTLLY